MDVSLVVSAYEADAQLVWLELHDIVDGLITEDGDVFAYGASTVYRLWSARDTRVNRYMRQDFVSATNQFTLDGANVSFVDTWMLAGCDYGTKIPGVGWKTALKALQGCSFASAVEILISDRAEGESYMRLAATVRLIYAHHCVWDVKQEEMVCLTPPVEGEHWTAEECVAIGRYVKCGCVFFCLCMC